MIRIDRRTIYADLPMSRMGGQVTFRAKTKRFYRGGFIDETSDGSLVCGCVVVDTRVPVRPSPHH
jgi:hypothetical protein